MCAYVFGTETAELYSSEEWDLGSATFMGFLFMFTCLKGAAKAHKAFDNIKFVFCVPI